MPPLSADFIHARACKLKCEKILTRPSKKDTQPPPSGSSLKRQRVQNIILEKRLSIYNAIGIQASVINRVVFLLTEIWFYCFSEYQSSLETAKKQAIFIFLKENLVLGNW